MEPEYLRDSNETAFEDLMKQIGDEIKAKGGMFILNPASVNKANEIIKRLNAIKAKDTDNEWNIKISMNVSDLIGYHATIMFTFDEISFDRKDFDSIKELLEFCDGIEIAAGYEKETTTVHFIINDYIVKLK